MAAAVRPVTAGGGGSAAALPEIAVAVVEGAGGGDMSARACLPLRAARFAGCAAAGGAAASGAGTSWWRFPAAAVPSVSQLPVPGHAALTPLAAANASTSRRAQSPIRRPSCGGSRRKFGLENKPVQAPIPAGSARTADSRSVHTDLSGRVQIEKRRGSVISPSRPLVCSPPPAEAWDRDTVRHPQRAGCESPPPAPLGPRGIRVGNLSQGPAGGAQGRRRTGFPADPAQPVGAIRVMIGVIRVMVLRRPRAVPAD